MISKNEGLKLVVLTLIKAVPNVINVAIICSIFYLIFGILFVSLKKGTFYSCYDD